MTRRCEALRVGTSGTGSARSMTIGSHAPSGRGPAAFSNMSAVRPVEGTASSRAGASLPDDRLIDPAPLLLVMLPPYVTDRDVRPTRSRQVTAGTQEPARAET